MTRDASLKSAGAALLLMLVLCGPASAAGNCLFELSGPEPDFLVLGTPVTPQATYLVVASCTKTADQVRDELVAMAHRRAEEAVAEAIARQERKKAGDEAWARMRAGQAQAAATEENAGLKGWWNGMWR